MSDLKFPPAPFNDKAWPQFVNQNRNAHISADYDSGWQPTAAGKTVTHNLGVVPSEVWVYASDDPQGNGFQPDTYTNANRTQVTINGALAYYRVRINKGTLNQSGQGG